MACALVAIYTAMSLIAVILVGTSHAALVTILEDIFVAVAILTISVGLILPGMIEHSAVEVANAAARLSQGTVREFSRAMCALGRGSLDEAHASVRYEPVVVRSRSELGEMADSFNLLQREIADAAVGLDGAREGLRTARSEVELSNAALNQRVRELDDALLEQNKAETKARLASVAAEDASAAKSRFLANMSHEIRTPMAGILGMNDLLNDTQLSEQQRQLTSVIGSSGQALLGLIIDMLD